MRLGFFQYAVISRNPAENLAYIGKKLADCRCDLLVLPELFTCGYSFDHPDELACFGEKLEDSPTVEALRAIAARIGGCVTGTIPERHGDRLYNTAILVDGGGLIGAQRKIHLPEYEKQFFDAGETISVFGIGHALKTGMMSCFDCWFPQFGAILRSEGAQIFCNSASFGGDVTPTILPIRARENQVFVVSCNRIGAEYFGSVLEHFCGKSQIISPDGKVLAEAESEEKLAVVDVDPDEINRPAFGSLICKNFSGEHDRYHTVLTQTPCFTPDKPMLFILGGLPASGKTSVARELAKLIGACHLRIDTLEQSLIRVGACSADQLEGKGYLIACELAKDQLNNGVSVIADCVNPLELTREWWREVASAVACPYVEVEFICSDTALHRKRSECRICDIDGLVQPDWKAITSREYEQWQSRHLVLDTARQTIGQSAQKILDYAGKIAEKR